MPAFARFFFFFFFPLTVVVVNHQAHELVIFEHFLAQEGVFILIAAVVEGA
ncbi:hypothetical protein D9M71_493640 [compost metagenome]